ncbi:MAG: hypothetical protein R2861_09915 [Desulfobacterales bacterium]
MAENQPWQKYDAVMQRLRRWIKYRLMVFCRKFGTDICIKCTHDLNIHLSAFPERPTGKILLALAAALEKRRHYRQILMARPIVPLRIKIWDFFPAISRPP